MPFTFGSVIGGTTGILALFSAATGVWSWRASARADRAMRIARLVGAAQAEWLGGHFATAWAMLAASDAIDPGNVHVRDAREQLAVLWVQALRAGDAEIAPSVRYLAPTLRGGAGRALGERCAELLAHAEWMDGYVAALPR